VYSASTFSATYTSNGPSGLVVTFKLTKGQFQRVAGANQSGAVTNDATSTTNDSGSAYLLFSASPNAATPGSGNGFLYASSDWCSTFPVAITL
jgi:hypothetical protein